jgi:hypothetical protein
MLPNVEQLSSDEDIDKANCRTTGGRLSGLDTRNKRRKQSTVSNTNEQRHWMTGHRDGRDLETKCTQDLCCLC